ncbi:MAG: hypothetical protein ISR65_15885 [Bacteriovoracaceae bacterium]|nr:hypothetical protein [Bacteriovoracaceae bacterium]
MKTLLFILLVVSANISVAAPLSFFKGTWHNLDSNTRGITKLSLTGPDNYLDIQAWGSCLPQDCNYGIVVGKVFGLYSNVNSLVAEYSTPYIVTTVVITYRNNRSIDVETTYEYTDGTPDLTTHDVFGKIVTPTDPLPDLKILRILRPRVTRTGSIVTVVIANGGAVSSPRAVATLKDGRRVKNIKFPPVRPNRRARIAFKLDYNIYNSSNALIRVDLDPKNKIEEYNELNNSKTYYIPR